MEFTTYTLGKFALGLVRVKASRLLKFFLLGSILFMEEMVLEDMLIEATLKENVQ